MLQPSEDFCKIAKLTWLYKVKEFVSQMMRSTKDKIVLLSKYNITLPMLGQVSGLLFGFHSNVEMSYRNIMDQSILKF